jgi:hypothetical protein
MDDNFKAGDWVLYGKQTKRGRVFWDHKGEVIAVSNLVDGTQSCAVEADDGSTVTKRASEIVPWVEGGGKCPCGRWVMPEPMGLYANGRWYCAQEHFQTYGGR